MALLSGLYRCSLIFSSRETFELVSSCGYRLFGRIIFESFAIVLSRLDISAVTDWPPRLAIDLICQTNSPHTVS